MRSGTIGVGHHGRVTATGPGATACYRHPDRTAGALCRRCGQPICPDCMREAPVGWQCATCTRQGHRRAPVTRWRPAATATLGSTRPSPVVIALIVANVVVYLATAHDQASVDAHYGLLPVAIDQGQWYRLLTAAFLHVSLSHIFFNMFTLAIVGPAVELHVGRVRFLALYLLAATGGSVCSYLLSPLLSLGVGASGAIFGLMGAYFVVARRTRTETRTVVALIVINLVIGFADSGIDWRAHVGGLLVGAAVAFGFVQADDRRARARTPQLASGAVIVVGALVLAGLAQLPPGHVNL